MTRNKEKISYRQLISVIVILVLIKSISRLCVDLFDGKSRDLQVKLIKPSPVLGFLLYANIVAKLLLLYNFFLKYQYHPLDSLDLFASNR